MVNSEIIKAVVEDHPDAVQDYYSDIDGALNFLVGQVMEETSGSVNPTEAHSDLEDYLEENQ